MKRGRIVIVRRGEPQWRFRYDEDLKANVPYQSEIRIEPKREKERQRVHEVSRVNGKVEYDFWGF